MAVIFPVVRDITMVAEDRRPDTTAREEATTAIEGIDEGEAASMVAKEQILGLGDH